MSILSHPSSEQLDRDIQVHKDVYALGLCVLQGKPQETVRTVLAEMHGMDWVAIPYSLARAMHDTISMSVARRLPYAAGHSLLHLDEVKGELKLTQLGDMAIKKLTAKIGKLV